jgi:hypothetical protein
VTAAPDRWHQLAGAIEHSNMTAADKAVFLFLLRCADYKTAELPARFTPTRQVIGRKTSLSYSQVGYSTRHLAKHVWLTAKGATGPGRTLEYSFDIGAECDCTGRVHAPVGTEHCQPEQATVPTGGTEHCQPTVPTPQVKPQNTLRGNEREERERKENTRSPPNWPLIRAITRIVAAAPGGGLHRAELAGTLHMSPYTDPFKTNLLIAYSRGQVDFCGQYVVKPPA